MLGAGAPSALQGIVASFPSKAVRFWGGFTRTGVDAEKKFVTNVRNQAHITMRVHHNKKAIRICCST